MSYDTNLRGGQGQYESQHSLNSNSRRANVNFNPGLTPAPLYQQHSFDQQAPPAYLAAATNQYPGQQQMGSSNPNLHSNSMNTVNSTYNYSNSGYAGGNSYNYSAAADSNGAEEDIGGDGTIFDDVNVRHNFIRKVYFIVLCQLLCTFGWMFIVLFVDPINQFMIDNNWLIWVGLGVSMGSLIALLCCGLDKKFPANIILLAIFTAGESLCLGTVSAFYNVDEVLIAFGICCGLTFALTIFAIQTKWDFTGMGPYLFGILIVLLIFGILCIFFQNRIMSIVYSSLGALVFCMYIIYDTQLIVGDKKRAFSPDDYIAAAITLYLDIINLFLMILQIIGLSNR